METLFNEKILVLSNADMRGRSHGRKKTYLDIKFSKLTANGMRLRPFEKANYVLYYDEDNMELTVLKERKEIIAGRHFLRHLIDVVWNHVTESEEVPSTQLADMLIDNATISHGN